MRISRLDLDGLGSPTAIAGRILEFENDLPLAIPLEGLCAQLDIASISTIDTQAFEAALVMDANKAVGAILLADHRRLERRRYSIAHELGHFLIPSHRPIAGHDFHCQLDDFHQVDGRERDRRRRIEAEANAFAAALLMPPSRLRRMMGSSPNIEDIASLARDFGVSKEAMARAYVRASHEPLAVLIIQAGRLLRVYRNDYFPWIEVSIGQPVPTDSIASEQWAPKAISGLEECDPNVWLSQRDWGRINSLVEQVLGQARSFAMVLLHAELTEPEDDDS